MDVRGPQDAEKNNTESCRLRDCSGVFWWVPSAAGERHQCNSKGGIRVEDFGIIELTLIKFGSVQRSDLLGTLELFTFSKVTDTFVLATNRDGRLESLHSFAKNNNEQIIAPSWQNYVIHTLRYDSRLSCATQSQEQWLLTCLNHDAREETPHWPELTSRWAIFCPLPYRGIRFARNLVMSSDRVHSSQKFHPREQRSQNDKNESYCHAPTPKIRKYSNNKKKTWNERDEIPTHRWNEYYLIKKLTYVNLKYFWEIVPNVEKVGVESHDRGHLTKHVFERNGYPAHSSKLKSFTPPDPRWNGSWTPKTKNMNPKPLKWFQKPRILKFIFFITKHIQQSLNPRSARRLFTQMQLTRWTLSSPWRTGKETPSQSALLISIASSWRRTWWSDQTPVATSCVFFFCPYEWSWYVRSVVIRDYFAV